MKSRGFSKYQPVEDSDDEELNLFQNVRKAAAASAPPAAESTGAVPPVFTTLRHKLVATAHNEGVPPFQKLTTFLEDIKAHLRLAHVSLVVISQNHWLQTVLRASGDSSPCMPSPASEIHPYSSSRQREEILQDDPQAILADYSASDGLPSDLEELAAAEGLTEFMLQGICNHNGQLKGMLVLGHPDRRPFESRGGWAALSECLQALLFTILEASNLHRYITFTESLKSVTKQADMIIVIAKWLPYLVLGPWGGVAECYLATLSPEYSEVTLYKGTQRVDRPEDVKPLSDRKIEANRSRNMRTLSSTSRILRSSTIVGAPSQQAPSKEMLLGHSNPLVESLRDLVPMDIGEDDSPANSCRNMMCVYKRLPAKGTLAESVVRSEIAVCIHDVHQHINEHPEGHTELLFNVSVGLPKSLLLLPIYKNDTEICGGLYLICHIKHDMLHIQYQAEVMLMIASKAIMDVMLRDVNSARSDGPPTAQQEASNKAVNSLVSKTIGENNAMEHYNDEQNLVALQRVFAGIITDYSAMAEAPQVCEPDQINITSVAGKGAFGIVYRGWIEGANTISAVKVMSIDPKMDAMLLLRNATEMAAMSKINHPNIVQIIAHFPDCVMLHMPGHGSGPFFRRTRPSDKKLSSENVNRRCCVLVMEYCMYGTLVHALNMDIFKHQGGAVDLSTVCSVLLELASALAFIHRHGIIHCDLKPQNVLLKLDECNPRGFVTKLADFGLARVVTHSAPALSGDSAGTPSHLAPEIVKVGDRKPMKTFKADVYAFGVLMWEMYMSREAFGKIDKQAVLTHVVLQCKRLPFPADADPAYVKLCSQCWDADMNVRPSFETVQRELRNIMRAHSNPADIGAPPKLSMLEQQDGHMPRSSKHPQVAR